MSTPQLVGSYQPGDSLVHRLPVGVKVSTLAVFSLCVVAVRSMPASWVFLALALGAALLARVSVTALARAARGVLLVAVVVAAFQWWLKGPDRAIETVVDLFALALVAVVLTATTPVNAMLDALVRWITPFRRLGAEPDRVALTVGLAVQAIPGTIAIAVETRDAARARGLERRPRAYLSPFVIRVVARAQETGDALAARGLGDD
ncbi:energy-coupling factor transporter transmembrane protein EcfT [Mumia zhuanghuii]|uniref:Energy-coupling factor transporter transmembrane component T family protein n=2 Tax=Mumia TaxID=1546255 RepID=A0ABW1QNX8_9ACTN|nr:MULTISPECIES: energy-coupling factor transporter transmembrane protein EcfT [Mumia]KAA1425123.1 energy-coupling factor transporter transmembrane protein EcfT [Mumia zhuanghuii]